MEDKKKNILKNWKLWVGIVLAIIVIICVIIFAMRNKMTPEETVSKFMYLVENKEYEKAKKLCSGQLEHLDLLANVKPSNLTFEYSKDKKEAKSVLLEDKEEAKMTTICMELENSLFGWKIKDYYISTDLIPQSILQKRLESGTDISESEFLLWAIYEETNAEDISKYANDNLIILTLFSDFMNKEQYEKAYGLYKRMSIDVSKGTELTEQEIKDFDWQGYIINQNVKVGGANVFIIKDSNRTINVMIGANHIISHIYTND